MKYQELIISPDIFSKFNNFVALDYKTYSSNLQIFKTKNFFLINLLKKNQNYLMKFKK